MKRPSEDNALTPFRSVSLALLAVVFTVLAAPQAKAEKKWDYSIKPYGWYVWFDGSTGAEGNPPVESDADLWEMLDGFFLIQGEARREKISLLGEFNWISMSDDFGISRDRIDRSSEWELEGYMLALGAGYALYEEAATRFEVIGGVRYWDVDVETEVLRRTVQADTTITDVFLGFRFEAPVADRVSLHGTASVGIAGDSDEQFDIGAEVRWRWTERTDLALGARYLKLDFEEDAVLVDASLYGPYAAINFRF